MNMKSVIVTGANRGIGLETALAFAQAGYKVFAAMRNPNGATSFKEKFSDTAFHIHPVTMDVDSDDSVNHCIEKILCEHGSIDVLVNNAGIERHGSIEDLTMADFKAVMETNYFGVLRCVKVVVPSMRKNKNGCIINITSIAGRIANTPLGAYSASKFALEAVSESLAQELKSFNIRVGIVEPGIINTQMASNISIGDDSVYPQAKRFAGLFAASLKTPTHPSLVAAKVLEIADSSNWQLRHPVGPDALPFLQWRAAMTDEEYVDWNAATDEDWYNAVQNTFGLNARQV